MQKQLNLSITSSRTSACTFIASHHIIPTHYTPVHQGAQRAIRLGRRLACSAGSTPAPSSPGTPDLAPRSAGSASAPAAPPPPPPPPSPAGSVASTAAALRSARRAAARRCTSTRFLMFLVPGRPRRVSPRASSACVPRKPSGLGWSSVRGRPRRFCLVASFPCGARSPIWLGACSRQAAQGQADSQLRLRRRKSLQAFG